MTLSPASTFAALHRRAGGFIMPNAWDAGTAKVLAAAGFPAIATTSAGIAFALGRQDYNVSDPACAVPREVMLEHMARIADAVGIPVNGDLEAGWGDSPEAVAQTIGLAIDIGLAGGNIEDRRPGVGALYETPLAVERIAAAREVIDSRGSSFVLCARTDALIWAEAPLEEAVQRANLYRRAGADCVYAPGASDLDRVSQLLGRIDAPLNVVIGLESLEGNAKALLAAGVTRVSLGGTIARAALAFVRRAADELNATGSLGFAAGQFSGAELNGLFASPAKAARATATSP